MEPGIFVFYLFGWLVSGLLIGLLAARKNRNGLLWGIIGGLFLLPGLIVLMFLPFLCPKCHMSLSNKQWRDRTCPSCGNLLE
jgi:biotin transporter BioY